jgi:hypothetical protein
MRNDKGSIGYDGRFDASSSWINILRSIPYFPQLKIYDSSSLLPNEPLHARSVFRASAWKRMLCGLFLGGECVAPIKPSMERSSSNNGQ